MPVTSTVDNGVGIIAFSNPPLNPISATAGIPQGISAEINALMARGDIRALVLTGEGKMFSAGADIAEFDKGPSEVGPPIRALCDLMDSLGVPVVAAVHGAALGGGLEVAMCADARVAQVGTRFGLPEVTLGIIPGAGGTQRLPRLVGAAQGARMIASAATISAEEAKTLGLVDEVVETDPRAAAVALALTLAEGSRSRARDRVLDTTGLDETLAVLRAKLPRDGRADAVSGALDAVAAGVEGFDQGLAAEFRIFDALVDSEPARGLRHAFLAERAVARVPGLDPAIKPRSISRVAIIGAGTMGTGISLAVVQAGLQAVVIDMQAAAVERARERTTQTIHRNRDKGRISAAKAEDQIARLGFGTDYALVNGVDLVIEAVFEDMEVKRQVFAQIDAHAAPGTILASNTSTLDLDQIAAFTNRPGDVVGMHFFSPANLMKLLEVVRGKATSDQTLADAMGFARQINKVGVVSGVCDGFIGNRMFEEMLRQAYFLLEEGALPSQVDAALESWGMAMGPLRTMDLAGNDIGWNIRKRRAVEQPDRPYSKIPDLICENGWYGQKTGRGFYRYGDKGPEVDPEVEAIVLAESERLGITRRVISDEEIVQRCIFALVNEGAKLLDEGIAARPLDIDTVWMNGYGFPRFRGGPMFYADRVGLGAVTSAIAGFATGPNAWAWEIAPLLARVGEQGGALRDLNGAR